MKIWIGNPKNIVSGYTYVANFDDAVSLVNHYKNIQEKNGPITEDLFSILEINVPEAEVSTYTSLFACLSSQEKPFYLNARLTE